MPEEQLGRKIDLLAKATAITLSVLYIFGYFVVSLRLAEFGIHSVELLRIQYLTAGFFSLGPLFLIYLLWSLAHFGFERLFVGKLRIGLPPAYIWSRIRWVLVLLLRMGWELLQVLVIAAVVIDAIASIFVPSVSENLLWHHPWIFMRVVRDSAMTVLGILALQRVMNVLRKEERGPNFKTASRFALPLLFSVFFFVSYTKQFSHSVYPEIPLAIGGGKPEFVVFLLRHDTGSDFAPVVRDKTGDRSIPYRLTLETDNSYAVISNDSSERAIQFNRQAVEGYVVMQEISARLPHP